MVKYSIADDSYDSPIEIPLGGGGLTSHACTGFRDKDDLENVLIAGGCGGPDNVCFKTVHFYKVSTGTWDQFVDLPQKRWGFHMIFFQGYFYFVGGGYYDNTGGEIVDDRAFRKALDKDAEWEELENKIEEPGKYLRMIPYNF